MVIVDNFEHAIDYAESLCNTEKPRRQYRTFQGSDFENEFTEQKSLSTLSEIVSCMEQGIVAIMYGLEMLYQSLYDLFNLNYISMGNSKYCRIAIGSESFRGMVHPEFKVILIADKHKVDDAQQIYDPPLLNRFEKQYLDPNEVLEGDQLRMKQSIENLLN